MLITIAERHRPFTHRPGLAIPLPGTTLAVKCYPAHVQLVSSEGDAVQEISLQVTGPVSQFTAMLDLERPSIVVSGLAASGPYRYRFVAAENNQFSVISEKGPPLPSYYDPKPMERRAVLSLGCTKKQEWDGIVSRCQMAEIIPLWLRLADQLPAVDHKALTGTASLATFDALKPEEIKRQFAILFAAGFSRGGLFYPTLEDESHQGIVYAPHNPALTPSPLTVIHEGARAIRSLFLQEGKDSLAMLPKCPPECHAGRFIDIPCLYGTLHFEWSKKTIRRVMLLPAVSGEVTLTFPSNVKTCRLHTANHTTKHRCGEAITLLAGQSIQMDHFQG